MTLKKTLWWKTQSTATDLVSLQPFIQPASNAAPSKQCLLCSEQKSVCFTWSMFLLHHFSESLMEATSTDLKSNNNTTTTPINNKRQPNNITTIHKSFN
jgi:hypothetical protein